MPRNLQSEISKLKKKILTLGGMVEERVQDAVASIENAKPELAKKVMESDDEVDNMEVNIEEHCLKVLALHQPVAIDLRFITSVIKITSDLERIGDLAANIAKRSIYIAKQEKVDIPLNFPRMARKTQEMLKKSLDALVNMDHKLALEVCASDDEVDVFNKETYDHVKQGIRSDINKMESLFYFLSVSRYLERIADHATNIAEDVIYMSQGKIIRHKTNQAVSG